MWIIGLVILIAVGTLGIASWLKTAKPEIGSKLAPLLAVEGWVGIAGLAWGLVALVQWLLAIGALAAAPLMMIIALASSLVLIALSLILGMGQLRTLAGNNAMTVRLGEVADRLAAFKVVLGAVCLGLAAWTLVAMI
jgi:hypothetical protein